MSLTNDQIGLPLKISLNGAKLPLNVNTAKHWKEEDVPLGTNEVSQGDIKELIINEESALNFNTTDGEPTIQGQHPW